MDEPRCAFCNATEAKVGRLYTYGVHKDGAPPRPGRIGAECSEMVNFMIRARHANEGRVFQPDAEFPAIASHRFSLRGPNREESEAVVEIGLPYIVNGLGSGSQAPPFLQHAASGGVGPALNGLRH